MAQNRPAPPDLSKLPKVTAVEVQFYTTTDDKDQDSSLLTDFRCGSTVFATQNSFPTSRSCSLGLCTDDFSDNHHTQWYSVNVLQQVLKDDLPRCTTTIEIAPQGHDTWRFNYWIRIHFSDNTSRELHFDEHALSEKVMSNTFSLK